MALFSSAASDVYKRQLCFRPVQQSDVFLGDPVVQTRLDNLESRQKGDTFQLRVAWDSLHELDEQDALSGSDGSEAETQRRGRLPLAVACVYHHQTMLFHCCLHCRDVICSIASTRTTPAFSGGKSSASVIPAAPFSSRGPAVFCHPPPPFWMS